MKIIIHENTPCLVLSEKIDPDSYRNPYTMFLVFSKSKIFVLRRKLNTDLFYMSQAINKNNFFKCIQS